MQDEVSIRHLRRDALRTRDEVPRSGKRLQGERTKRWKNTRNIYRYSIGTDGFRFLCHQFTSSCLPLLENCISRCNTCWLKMKQLTPVLLRWVANGGQGQNARRPVFPLPTGQAWCSVWWSRRNRSQ